MTTAGQDHQQEVYRNRDAVSGYLFILGLMSIPVILLLFTSRQWDIGAFLILIMLATLRYLLPVSATVLPDGRIRYVWPLRRVTVGPENLVTARILPNTISREPLLALRVHRGVRFAGFSSQWADGPGLASALATVVADASRVPALDRQASAALLDAAARRHS